MRNFAIIQDGVIANIIIAPADWAEGIDITGMDPMPAIGWHQDESGNFTAPAGFDEPEPPPASRIITNLAFDLRFTAAERVAIEMASLDDPAAPQEARMQSAYIRVALQRANKASYTDLDDPVTRAAVQQFEQYGMIDAGRAIEILDAPVADRERPAA